MEETFKALTIWLASGTEAAAALVIALATVEAVVRALILFIPGLSHHIGPREPQDAKEQVRLVPVHSCGTPICAYAATGTRPS